MRRALLALLLVLVAGCGAGKAPPPKTQGVLCVWPDPIVFNGSADSWVVCFEVPFGIDPPVCRTVGELRQLIRAGRLAE